MKGIPALEGKKHRCIIAGGRDYQFTEEDIRKLDRFIPYIEEVISGGARGADTQGELWAETRGLTVRRFPADWEKHGKKAGPIRNREMALNADVAILFPGGAGTASMRMIAHEEGLIVFNFSNQ